VNQSTLSPNLLYSISPSNKCEGEHNTFRTFIFSLHRLEMWLTIETWD
jgi:hypothetical protein